MLASAVHAFVTALPGSRQCRAEASLMALESDLGAVSPLLTSPRLPGEVWIRTLPEAEQAEAHALLNEFRSFLRDSGWPDAARPVNQLD